jgi:hypothetical protein
MKTKEKKMKTMTEVLVQWDLFDTDAEYCQEKGPPARVEVPGHLFGEDVTEWLTEKYGFLVKSWQDCGQRVVSL